MRSSRFVASGWRPTRRRGLWNFAKRCRNPAWENTCAARCGRKKRAPADQTALIQPTIDYATMMNIRQAAVIGAGTMGAQIAAHLANVGIPVLLLDVVPTELTPEEQQKGLN